MCVCVVCLHVYLNHVVGSHLHDDMCMCVCVCACMRELVGACRMYKKGKLNREMNKSEYTCVFLNKEQTRKEKK